MQSNDQPSKKKWNQHFTSMGFVPPPYPTYAQAWPGPPCMFEKGKSKGKDSKGKGGQEKSDEPCFGMRDFGKCTRPNCRYSHKKHIIDAARHEKERAMMYEALQNAGCLWDKSKGQYVAFPGKGKGKRKGKNNVRYSTKEDPVEIHVGGGGC